MRALVHGGAVVTVALCAVAIYTLLVGGAASVVIRRLKSTRPLVAQPKRASSDQPRDPFSSSHPAGDHWCADLDPSLLVLDALLDEVIPLDEPDRSLVLAKSSREPSADRGRGFARLRESWPAPALTFRRKERDVTAPPSPGPLYAAALIATACVVAALIFSDSGVIPNPGLWSSSRPVTKEPHTTQAPTGSRSAEHPFAEGSTPSRPSHTPLADRAPQAPAVGTTRPNSVAAVPIGVLAPSVPPLVYEVSFRTPIASQPTPSANVRRVSAPVKPLVREQTSAKPHMKAVAAKKAAVHGQNSVTRKGLQGAVLARPLVRAEQPTAHPNQPHPVYPAAQPVHHGQRPAAAAHHPHRR